MLDVNAALLELVQLAATGSALQAYAYPPDKPEVPAIFAEEWAADFTEDGTPLGDGGFYTATLVILVSLVDDKDSRARRNALVKSAVDSLDAGTTLLVSDLFVTAVRAPADMREFGAVSYVYAEIDLTVFG